MARKTSADYLPEWIKHPRLKAFRAVAGVVLVGLGMFGFLPVLGFWMIPVGLAILALDFPAAERANQWLLARVRRLRARWRLFRARRRRPRGGDETT